MCVTDRYDDRLRSLSHGEDSVAVSSKRLNDSVPLELRTAALLRGLSLVLRHHGAPNCILDELQKGVHWYLDSSQDETVWLTRAKHMLAYPLARYLRCEAPKAPEMVWKPSGVLRNWFKLRIIKFNRKNSHLWYSWFQAKRSSLPASEDFVENTYKEHLVALTKTDPGVESTIDEILADPTFKRVIAKVRGAVNYYFRDLLSRNIELVPWAERDFINKYGAHSPSNSACFEKTRTEGGQLAALLEAANTNPIHLLDTFGSVPDWQKALNCGFTTELVGMSYLPVSYTQIGMEYGRTREERVVCGREDWESLFSKLPSIDDNRPLFCTIQAVLEPFKVRVISKGESVPYYFMKPLQEALHGCMRKMPCFRLIGRPFSPCDMLDLAMKAKPTDQWFSVDYSAATDKLSWRYSGEILRMVIRDLPYNLQKLALQVLGPHALHYPLPCGGRGFKGYMQTGQLMGSILSFPILCLANLGVYLYTNQFVQKEWTDEERLNHVLVNGDDMLYAADASLWDQHIEIGEHIGLTMSVGKSYHHPIYANINSTSVHHDLGNRSSTPHTVGYLNAGLMFGMHKVQGKSDNKVDPDKVKTIRVDYVKLWEYFGLKTYLQEEGEPGVCSNIETLLAGSLPGKEPEVLKDYLSYHREEIRRECAVLVRYGKERSITSRNLFIPAGLGGMGIKPPLGWKYKISRSQCRLARHYTNAIKAPYVTQRPVPGHELTELPIRAAPWCKPTSTIEAPYIDLTDNKCLPRSEIIGGVYFYAHNPSSFRD